MLCSHWKKVIKRHWILAMRIGSEWVNVSAVPAYRGDIYSCVFTGLPGLQWIKGRRLAVVVTSLTLIYDFLAATPSPR